MIEQPAHVLRGQIRLERPWGVDVAEHVTEVRYILEQHALVGHATAGLLRLAIDAQLHAAEHLQLQTGGGDDDVGLQLAAGLQLDARLGEVIDMIGDDGGIAFADRREQIAIRHGA